MRKWTKDTREFLLSMALLLTAISIVIFMIIYFLYGLFHIELSLPPFEFWWVAKISVAGAVVLLAGIAWFFYFFLEVDLCREWVFSLHHPEAAKGKETENFALALLADWFIMWLILELVDPVFHTMPVLHKMTLAYMPRVAMVGVVFVNILFYYGKKYWEHGWKDELQEYSERLYAWYRKSSR